MTDKFADFGSDQHLLETAAGSDDQNNGGDRTQTFIQDPIESIHREASSQFESIHPEEEGDQERSNWVTDKIDQAFNKALPGYESIGERARHHERGRQE